MKSPKIHPRFYPSTLILVLASQIPVPLFKKKISVAKETAPSGELARSSTAKKSSRKSSKVTACKQRASATQRGAQKAGKASWQGTQSWPCARSRSLRWGCGVCRRTRASPCQGYSVLIS